MDHVLTMRSAQQTNKHRWQTAVTGVIHRYYITRRVGLIQHIFYMQRGLLQQFYDTKKQWLCCGRAEKTRLFSHDICRPSGHRRSKDATNKDYTDRQWNPCVIIRFFKVFPGICLPDVLWTVNIGVLYAWPWIHVSGCGIGINNSRQVRWIAPWHALIVNCCMG